MQSMARQQQSGRRAARNVAEAFQKVRDPQGTNVSIRAAFGFERLIVHGFFDARIRHEPHDGYENVTRTCDPRLHE
jgi:hypothetical protein